MSLTVVLVRHGKAEKKASGQPDEARALTHAGREALKEAFPRSLSLLHHSPAGGIEVWVSPALRAYETADEVCEVIGVDETQDHPCLFEQDVPAFVSELSARFREGPGTVVVVGHVPFMDKASGVLCGCELPFGTGAMAAIEFDSDPAVSLDEGKAPGKLQWFVQGPRVA